MNMRVRQLGIVECRPELNKVWKRIVARAQPKPAEERHDTVQLYERLASLGEVVFLAGKEEREEGSVAADGTRKLEYISAKCADYRRGVESGEGVLPRNGG